MPGGYSFNHVDTLKMIDLYYNSKYKTGMYDPLGQRKFFYNVVKPACDIATKFVDLDTKDIILSPEGADDEIPTWFMQKKLKRWLQEYDFGCLLNEIGFDYPKYGHVVIKEHKDGFKKVNLQNLRVDPTAECLDKSTFVYEVVSMSRGEISGMKWDTKELFSRGDDQNFIIYDCYEMDDNSWKHTVYGDLFSKKDKDGINRAVESEINNQDDFYGSLELFTETVDELPYYELVWEKVPGRWLGYGFVEYLEENQIAVNEAENLERAGLKFSSLHLFQTRDEDVAGSNILTNTQNGSIIKVNSEITKIAMEERNLAAFNNTRNNWSANTERKTFTTDITSGANLPSRTPLGVAQLQAAGSSSYFELKRENYGLFVKELLLDKVLPDFLKDTRKEHVLMFASSDQDIDNLDRMISKMMVDDAVVDYALKTGFFPSQQEKDALKERIMGDLKRQKNRYINIPKNYYADASYFVDVNITGENMDNGAKSQVIQLALQIVGTNPNILSNPVTKQMLFNLLSLGGISPVDLGLMNDAQPQQPQQGQDQMPQQVAGSLAKPSPMQPAQTPSTTTF